MKIEFLGVGEDCDGQHSSASFFIHTPSKILIDCGLNTPAKIISQNLGKDEIDAVYLTHTHAGHCFGLSTLLLDRHLVGRTKPLLVVGQPGTAERIRLLAELSYPGMLSWLSFQLEFIETTEAINLLGLKWDFALTSHSLDNYALRISNGVQTVGISGDGDLTPESAKLFSKCTTVVHEAYKASEPYKWHCTAKNLLEKAEGWPELKSLYLVHLEREDRKHRMDEFEPYLSRSRFNVRLPLDGEIWTVD